MDKYVKKGSLVSVEGRIQTRNYDNKDGNRIYVTEVVAENVRMLSSKGNERNSGNNYDDYEPVSSQRINNDYESQLDVSYDISDDDLPF
jgi:single-strand DNA-binding protein